MRFEWHDSKNRTNFRKHKLWFEEAQTVWTDKNSVEFFDPAHSDDEDRFIRIGRSLKNKVLLVVFCENENGQLVRIISVRKATKREALIYEEGI